jgi:hypothetical protein
MLTERHAEKENIADSAPEKDEFPF